MQPPLSVPELMHRRTAYSALLTTPAVRERFAEMCRQHPELAAKQQRELDYVWDWVHSAGVCRDEALRGLVPALPPAELRQITSAADAEFFLFTGLLDISSFVYLFHRHREAPQAESPVRVLDFGAGCGRMVRFFSGHRDRYEAFASEVNPAHVEWMRENLRDIRVLQNGAMPPLPGGEGFDFIYSLSVFTHLNAAATDRWMEELESRLRPGGIVVFTTHGDRALEITAESASHQSMLQITGGTARGIRANLRREGFVYLRYDEEVLRMANAGSDYGISFMDVDWIRRRWPRSFEMLEFIPAAVRGWQDVVVMRRRG